MPVCRAFRNKMGSEPLVGGRSWHLLLGVAIGVIAVQGLHAQGAKPKAYAASEKALAEPADKTALLSELMKLEAASWQSLKDRNVSAMNKYLADDAVLIFGDGSHFTKSE